MIAADRFHDNGDGTAWLLPRRCPDDRAPQGAHWWRGDPCVFGYRALDRPCDTCDEHDPGWDHYGKCPDCIDGRHTFDIAVECSMYPPDECPHRFRASVVPGMVLPLVAIDTHCIVGPPYIIQTQPSRRWWGMDNGSFPCQQIDGPDDITLPPAAEPGMWAVKLRIEAT